jgi:type IV pilus assembly protein PilM
LFLRRWLDRTPSNLVGLDIQPETIKLLEIIQHGNEIEIANFGLTNVPAGAMVKDEIKDPASVGNTLRELFRDYNIKSKNVALAIPRSAAIIKNITIDSRLTPTEIESRAWVEANRYFPDLVGDIHLDFSITGPAAGDVNQLDMVLVACRKEQIKPYLDVINYSGLTAKIVDVNCYALERAMSLINSPNPLESVALLNLNYTLSSLVVIQNKQLIYAHDHTYDGVRLTTQVKRVASGESRQPNVAEPVVSMNPAAAVAATPAAPIGPQTPESEKAEYYRVMKENLSSHLRHSMHFFYSSRPNVSIQKLFVAGDCATIPYLVEFIKDEVNIDTELANPFTNMKLSPHINADELHRVAPVLVLSCGLALSKL